MRKLFTSLCVAVLTVVGAASAWAQNSFVYEKTNTKLTAEQLTAGTLVTIQATGNNNSGFFGGTGPVSATFRNDGSTVYEIVKEEGASTISFKQVSSGLYLKNPTGNNPGLDFVTNISEAAKMTVAKADGTDGKANATTFTGNLIANVEVGALYRFKVGHYILNCQRSNSPAGWRGGDLGWTVFYIWQVNKVTPVTTTIKYNYDGKTVKEETRQFNPSLSYAAQGFSIPIYYGLTGSATPSLDAKATANELILEYVKDVNNPYPFEFFEDKTVGSTYYTLQVKDFYAKYNNDAAATANSFNLGTDVLLNDSYKFLFVGNPIAGFLAYNKEAGLEKALSVTDKNVDNAKFNLTGTEVRLHLKERGGQFFFLLDGTNHNYVNYREPYLSTWNSPTAISEGQIGNSGSRILFKKATEEFFYTNQLKEYKASKLTYYQSFPVIFKNVAAAQAELEQLSYTDFTEEGLTQAKAKVDEIIKKIEDAAKNASAKVFIKNRSHHNEYMESTASGELYARTTDPAATHQYELRYQGEKNFYIYSSVARNYVQAASQSAVVKSGATQQLYRMEIAPNANGAANVATFFSVGGNNYSHLHYAPHQQNGIVGWDAPSPASQWTIVESTITDQEIQRAINAFVKGTYEVAKAKLMNIPVHAEKFGCAQPTDLYQAALEKIKEMTPKVANETATEEEYKAAVVEIEAGINSLTTFNGLKDNVFYSFKGIQSQKYLAAPNTTKILEGTSDFSLANVFFAKNRVLTSVKEGKQVGLNTDAALLDYGVAGLPISGEAFPDDLDQVYVKVDQRYTYMHDNGVVEGLGHIQQDVQNGFKFEVKEVTEIPLPIREIGYASFYTPVALTVQQGYTAYKATKDPENVNSLVLTEITGTIPANTAFVVKGETNTTCTLTVVKNDAGVEVGENVLSGGVETTAIQGTAYALTKKGESEAVFGKVSAEVKQIAFRAFYINNTVNPVNEMSFSFKSTLTGVAPLKGNNEAASLYDLSGRRVLSPAKGGIYIQNGQKIIAQ